jgi:hypothetical protein
MKGMQKISRGSGFGGLTKYGLVNANGDVAGRIIGGNMSGATAEELTKEFGLSRKLRPDIKKPVWHNSLRSPEGEKLTDAQFNAFADDYLKRMGFTDAHQRVYIMHDDDDGRHIHIEASRIGLDGTIYYGKNENLKSSKIINRLEKVHGIEQTKGPNVRGDLVMPDVKRPTFGEVGKFKRTGETPDREALAKLIDQAIADKPSASVFAERLVLSGIEVRANFNKGTLNGFSFKINNVPFKGSQLGKQYTGQALLERGLTYVADRDYAQLKSLTAASAGIGQRDAAAKAADGVQPGAAGRAIDAGRGEPDRSLDAAPGEPDRAIDPARGSDGGKLRGIDGPGARDVERGSSADDRERPGRSDRAENGDRESRRAADEVDYNATAGGQGTEKAAGTEAGREGSPANDHHRVARPDAIGHHDGHPAALDSGVEVTDAGFIETGIKAIDDLQRASHKDRLKAERERIAASKKNWEAHGAHVKKTLDEWRRPHAAQLSRAAFMAHDSAACRAAEIGLFAKATGAQRFEVTCSSSKPGQKSVKKVFTAEQLQNPSIIRSMATMSARRFNVSIRPDPASGVILLKGLDADGIKKLEAIGLAPAAVVDIAGKKEAWIRTDAKLSTDERTALTKRLEALTGVEQKHGGAGGLVGFSSAQKLVRLSDCPGQVAPAVGELIGEIRAESVEAKKQAAQVKLETDGKAWEALFGESNPVQQPATLSPQAIMRPEPVPVPEPEPSEPKAKADFEAKPRDPTDDLGGDLQTSTDAIADALGLRYDKNGNLIKPKSGSGDGTGGTTLG